MLGLGILKNLNIAEDVQVKNMFSTYIKTFCTGIIYNKHEFKGCKLNFTTVSEANGLNLDVRLI